MPPRNKSNGGAAVAEAPKTVDTVPISGEVTGTVEKTEKVKPEKTPKPEVVYAEPIKPLETVVYPFVCVTVCGSPEQHGMSEEKITQIGEAFKALGIDGLMGYSDPITAVDAQGLIGWETERKDGPKFGDDYAIKDYYEKKVRLHKNIRNRPIYQQNLEAIVQNILNARWELNGETLIISDTGNVLDGQHTLVALCIAQQRLEYEKDTEGKLKWASKWPSMVVSMPKIIVYGIKGTDSVVNTMNTCKPRTFADVLYRSPYFADLKAKSSDGLDRQTAARVTSHAVSEVWQRTGMYTDGYSARITNSEGMAWIESHGGMEGKFLECVKHVLEEDVHGHISKYLQCGKAVTLMWLGAAGNSDEEKYYALRVQDRDAEAYNTLNWKYWKTAATFWKEFGDREPDKIINEGKDGETTVKGKARGPLKALTDYLDELNNSEEPMVREKDFVIARAWSLWLEEKNITLSGIRINDKDREEPDAATGLAVLKKTKHLRFGSLDLGMDRIRVGKELSPEAQDAAEKGIADAKAKTLEELEGSGVVDAPVTATDAKLVAIKPQAQQDCETLAAANPELNVVLVKTYSGKMELWGAAVGEVSKLMKVEPSTHPNDSQYLKFDAAEWENLSNAITGAGYSVGLGDKVDGKLEIVMVSKPGTKNGNGHKRR